MSKKCDLCKKDKSPLFELDGKAACGRCYGEGYDDGRKPKRVGSSKYRNVITTMAAALPEDYFQVQVDGSRIIDERSESSGKNLNFEDAWVKWDVYMEYRSWGVKTLGAKLLAPIKFSGYEEIYNQTTGEDTEQPFEFTIDPLAPDVEITIELRATDQMALVELILTDQGITAVFN